jgi:CHAD domain-containing protein
MAFCFKRNESVSKAVRRLSRSRIQDALDCLKDCRQAEAIHCARKDIKRVRAVLRLVRTGIKKKQFRRVSKHLRQAANSLAAPRDAYVKISALKNLAHHFKGQLSSDAFRHIRADLRDAFDEEMKRFAKKRTIKAVQHRLRRVGKELGRLKIEEKGWKVLGRGLSDTYSSGQHAYRAALKDLMPDNFHEWRKRAKDLWYQVTLMQPIWPEQMEATAKELESLGESLGDDHDLFMLRQAIREQSRNQARDRELEALGGLIEQRQDELRTAALALGSRFYAEKTSAFCHRLAGYWQTWRGEKRPMAVR